MLCIVRRRFLAPRRGLVVGACTRRISFSYGRDLHYAWTYPVALMRARLLRSTRPRCAREFFADSKRAPPARGRGQRRVAKTRTSWRTSCPKLARQRVRQQADCRDSPGTCGGGAEGDRTPDLLIANKAPSNSTPEPPLVSGSGRRPRLIQHSVLDALPVLGAAATPAASTSAAGPRRHSAPRWRQPFSARPERPAACRV